MLASSDSGGASGQSDSSSACAADSRSTKQEGETTKLHVYYNTRNATLHTAGAESPKCRCKIFQSEERH